MRTPATSEKANGERPAVTMTTVNIPLVNEVQLSAATGGTELSCYRCTVPFGVVVLIAGIVVTSVAYSFNSHGSTISYFGLVLLSAGLVLLASSAICWKVRMERKKERRRESQTTLVSHHRSIFTWTNANPFFVRFLSLQAINLNLNVVNTVQRVLDFQPVKALTANSQNSKLWRHYTGFICQRDVKHVASWERSQEECITIKMKYCCAQQCAGSLSLICCCMQQLWLQWEGLWTREAQDGVRELECSGKWFTPHLLAHICSSSLIVNLTGNGYELPYGRMVHSISMSDQRAQAVIHRDGLFNLKYVFFWSTLILHIHHILY